MCLLYSQENRPYKGRPPQLTRCVKPKFESRFLLMPSCESFGSYNSVATHRSGTGPLSPTQIRGADISGEHLSVPACGRTACSAPSRGMGVRQDSWCWGRTLRYTGEPRHQRTLLGNSSIQFSCVNLLFQKNMLLSPSYKSF